MPTGWAFRPTTPPAGQRPADLRLTSGNPMSMTAGPGGTQFDKLRAGSNFSVPRSVSVPQLGTANYEVPPKPWETSNVMADNSGHRLVNDEVRHLWGCSYGTAQYHFPMVDDSIARHSRSLKKLEKLKEENRFGVTSTGHGPVSASYGTYCGYNILEHPENLTDKTGKFSYLKSLTSYEAQAKRMVAGVEMTPPPEQAVRTHWLCQVNSMTNRYNLITNRAPNVHIHAYRQKELDKSATFKAKDAEEIPRAGDVQPTPVVSCKEGAYTFVPLLAHPPIGAAGRRNWDVNVTGYVRRSIT